MEAANILTMLKSLPLGTSISFKEENLNLTHHHPWRRFNRRLNTNQLIQLQNKNPSI
jgi:hypothetical protein